MFPLPGMPWNCPPLRIVVSAICVAIALFVQGAPVEARTLLLTDGDCERIAVISAEAPRLSWTGFTYGDAFYTNVYVELVPQKAFLIRFPLEQIPAGQRILNAELTMPVILFSPTTGPRLNLHRMISSWGPGVCYDYRSVLPKKEKWHAPGASAPGLDRAAKPTATVRVITPGECVVNVTKDVELWYSAQARNEGWYLMNDDPNSWIRMVSPGGSEPGHWKLRVTYEPE